MALYQLFRRSLPKPSLPAKPAGGGGDGGGGDWERLFISQIHSARSLGHLRIIHARIFRLGLAHNTRIATQLIAAAGPFRSAFYAVSVLGLFSFPNSFLFDALIRLLSESSLHSSSLNHYTLMRALSLPPSRLSLPFALRSAASLPSPNLLLLSSLHLDATKSGLEMDPFVRISLVDAFVKSGSYTNALKLFDETPEPHKSSNVLLWNVAITGCCRLGNLETAEELFHSMPERSISSWNSLLDGFMKNGNLKQAGELFDRMPERNVVTWTTMISGFSQHGENHKALVLFDRMLEVGARPNAHTMVSLLTACSRMGSLRTGMRIHQHMIKTQGVRINTQIGAALIDMYSSCGEIDIASKIFYQIEEKDLLSWTALISAFALHGCSQQALGCFEEMMLSGIHPDEVVILSVLMACSHSGMVEKGLQLFDSMKRDHGIQPTLKHYTCVVDLYGRAGRLTDALELVESMPFEADFVTWGALFSACKLHKNVAMAELVSKRIQEIRPRHHGSHVFLSNVYAASKRWDDVERVRRDMKGKKIDREPGWSCIEIGQNMSAFVSGDRSHPLSKEINNKLEQVITSARRQGYVPDTECVLHDVEEEEKEDSVGTHSEKLALSLGLLTTQERVRIKIVKNLRVCIDCHSLMKIASKIYNREIVLRDGKRFHHFKDGSCSCQDYW